MVRAALLPRWLGTIGVALALGIAAGLAEPAGWELGGTINALSYLAWALWLMAVGVTLLVRRAAPLPSAHRALSLAPAAARGAAL